MPQPKAKDIAAALQAASVHLNEGRPGDALAISDAVLKQAGNNADAFHISGLSRLQLGQPADALPLLQSAQSARSSDGAIANSLAQAHLSLGQVTEAAKKLERLAKKNKLPAAGLCTLGNCRLAQNELGKALACFKKALELQPDLVPAMVNIGEALKASGDREGAIQHYKKVLQNRPDAQSAWRNLGLLLQETERFEESIQPLERYLANTPQDAASIQSLGVSHFKMGNPADALTAFDRALALTPNDAETLNNQGLALRGLNRTQEARSAFEAALEINPAFEVARINLGNLLHRAEGPDAALEIMNDAVKRAPDDPKAHMERGHILLQEGQIAAGWDDYRWRFQLPPEFAGKRTFAADRWTGQDLTGKTLLVWGEQGIGDEIIYASLLPEVISRAHQVVIECAPRLAPIIQRSFPDTKVVQRGDPAHQDALSESIDFQTSSGDLCEFLRPDLSAFPAPAPYLLANPDLTKTFKDKYSGTTSNQIVVGIAWHSGRAKDGWIKSIPLDLWGPILSQQNLTFVSLQYGDHGEEIESVRTKYDCDLIADQEVDALKDMDTFAAQVAAMDLVICNSNAAAHMAGALGRPVWTMVPHLGSGALLWYWFKDGKTSPWYDNMTLHRQTQWQRWTDVIQTVADDLKSFVAQATRK